MELGWRVKLFLLCMLVYATTRECSAALNITQGRITKRPFKLTRQPVVGLATIELDGDSASLPTYFFDCVTDRNNGSGLRWTRSSFPHSFEVDATPDGVPGIRMDVDGIDYPDLDIYNCSDRFSDDVARLNITDLNPAIMAAEERVEVLQGETAELEIYVSGFPFPTESAITWLHPNQSTISSSDPGVTFQDEGRKLILANVQANQAGLYQPSVVISYAPYMGSFTQIQLDVHVPTVLVTQPVESVDALEWSAVTLTCSASGVPKPQIRWERENQPTLPVGANTSDIVNYNDDTGNTTTSQLVFAKIRYEAIGRYRCVADNRETDAVMSDYANVRVTPTLRLYNDRMEVVNDLYKVNDGARVMLECFGSGNLEWTSATGSAIPLSESGIIYQSYDQTRDALALTILNFMSTNTAVYTCMTDLTGTYNGPITVSVLITNSNPAVFLRLRVYYVLPGNTTTLEARVHASSSSMAVVRWYHANRLINDASENSYTASSEGDIYRLEVNSVSESELGRYTVVVTLDGRMANDTTTLSYPEPPTATITPSSVTVNEGDEVTITCQVEGSGTVTVTWTMAGGNLPPDGVEARGNQLIIASATSSHHGTYVCTVGNLAGTSQAEVTLNVFYLFTKTPNEEDTTTTDERHTPPSSTVDTGISGSGMKSEVWIYLLMAVAAVFAVIIVIMATIFVGQCLRRSHMVNDNSHQHIQIYDEVENITSKVRMGTQMEDNPAYGRCTRKDNIELETCAAYTTGPKIGTAQMEDNPAYGTRNDNI